MSDGADPPADAVGGSVAPGGADETVAGAPGERARPVPSGQAPAGGEERKWRCGRRSAGGASEPEGGSPERDPASCSVCVPGALGVLLGAAVLGGVGVWLYLHFSISAEHRASHRIDDLRQRLDQLSHQFAEYATEWERPGAGSA